MSAVADLSSSVVQVFTSGMDWPAVVAAISGGVVGVTGILASWRQSIKTVGAEDERAKRVEKRRVYAQCLVALTEDFQATTKLQALKEDTDLTFRIEITEARASAHLATLNAVFEVVLIASTQIVRIVMEASRHLGRTAPADEAWISEWAKTQARLLDAMRDDLDGALPERSARRWPWRR